jgi:hypothetical protein
MSGTSPGYWLTLRPEQPSSSGRSAPRPREPAHACKTIAARRVAECGNYDATAVTNEPSVRDSTEGRVSRLCPFR